MKNRKGFCFWTERDVIKPNKTGVKWFENRVTLSLDFVAKKSIKTKIIFKTNVFLIQMKSMSHKNW